MSVYTGDIAVFESRPGTFLAADSCENVIFDVNNGDIKVPVNFNRCHWRLCERLSYSEQTALHSMNLSKRQSSFQGNVVKSFVDQAEKEQEANEVLLTKAAKKQLFYGQVVQVQHVCSGKFLANRNFCAKLDHECQALSLETGSQACYFLVRPRYKVRSDGAPVLINDVITLTSVMSHGFNVHESHVQVVPGVHEANASQNQFECGLTIDVYFRPNRSDMRLAIGHYFRFCDREADGYVQVADNYFAPKVFLALARHDHVEKVSISSKAVWTIENISRRVGGYIEYDKSEYRIKHVSTAKYLTVGSELEAETIVETSDDGQITVPLSLTGDKLELLNRQTFKFKQIGGQFDYLPFNDALASIVHDWHPVGAAQSIPLVFHTPAVEGDEVSVNCMTSLFQPFDALVVMPVDTTVESNIHFIGEVVPILSAYAVGLNTAFPKTYAELQPINAVLSQVINRSIVGEDENADPLFADGAPNGSMQIYARELFLLDILLAIVKAPVSLGLSMNAPKGLEWVDKNFKIMSVTHRLAWRCLEILVTDNTVSGNYMVNVSLTGPWRSVPAINDPTIGRSSQSNECLDITIGQIQHPVGAASFLSKWISCNKELLTNIVDINSVQFFKNLLLDSGPKASLLSYFHSICSCNNEAMRKNQELLVEELLYNKESYNQLMIKIFSKESASPRIKYMKKIPDEMVHVDYLGKNIIEKDGFPRVYVAWSHLDKWAPGSGKLFWSPLSLGMKVDEDDNMSVPIEEFFWPLEKEKLCDAARACSWADFENNMEADESMKIRFSDHLNIAQHAQSQIEVYAEMLFDHCYDAIYALEKLFPYDTILSIIMNDRLPFRVRGSFVKLMKRLWVERSPCQANCGRQSLPDRIWIFKNLADLTLDDDEAFPNFYLDHGSPFRNHPDPFYSIGHPDKYFSLVVFAQTFLESLEKQVVNNVNENQCLTEVISLVGSLTSFGFLSTTTKIVDILKPLIGVMDGRQDVMNDGDTVQSFIPVKPSDIERYDTSFNSIILTKGKTKVLEVIVSVLDLRKQFFLSKLLYLFRQWSVDKNDNLAVEKLLQVTKSNDYSQLSLDVMIGDKIDASLMDLMMYEDQALFEAAFRVLKSENETLINLLKIARSVLLLDENELPVFGTFNELSRMCSFVSMAFDTVYVWGRYLIGTTKSHKETAFNGLADSLKTFGTLMAIFNKLKQYLILEPTSQRQNALLNLGMLELLVSSLHWDLSAIEHRAPSDSQFVFFLESDCEEYKAGESRDYFDIIHRECLVILRLMAENNHEIRRSMVGHTDILLEKLPHFDGTMLELILSIFKGSSAIVMLTPPAAFDAFGKLLSESCSMKKAVDVDRMGMAISFFYNQLVPESIPINIECNQLKVLDILKKISLFKLTYAEVEKLDRERRIQYLRVFQLVTLTCRENQDVISYTRKDLIPWEQLEPFVSGMVDTLMNNLHSVNAESTIALAMHSLCIYLDLMACIYFDEKWFDSVVILEESLESFILASIKLVCECCTKCCPAFQAASSSFCFIELMLDTFGGFVYAVSCSGGDGKLSSKCNAELKYMCYHLAVSTPEAQERLTSLSEQMGLLGADADVTRGKPGRKKKHFGRLALNVSLANAFNIASKGTGMMATGFQQGLTAASHLDATAITNVNLASGATAIHNAGAGLLTMGTNVLSTGANLAGSTVTGSVAAGLTVAKVGTDLLSTGAAAATNAGTSIAHGSLELVAAGVATGANLVVPSSEKGGKSELYREVQSNLQLDVLAGLMLPRNDGPTSPSPTESERLKEVGMSAYEFNSFLNMIDGHHRIADECLLERQSLLHNMVNIKALSDPLDPVYLAPPEEVKVKSSWFSPYSRVYMEEETSEKVVKLFRSNAISWDDFVHRMITYVDKKMAEPGNDLGMIAEILEIFASYLLEGKHLDEVASDTLATSDATELSDQHKTRQTELNDMGLGLLCCRLMSHYESGCIFEAAVGLASSMLEDGNRDTQKTLIDFSYKNDPMGNLFLHLIEALRRAITWVSNSHLGITKSNTSSVNDNNETYSDELNSQVNLFVLILNFLQRLCEGHNASAQNLIRDQSNFGQFSYNLVDSAATLLETIVSSNEVYHSIELAHRRLLVAALDMLIDCMQGPCRENQKLISRNKVFQSCAVILVSPVDKLDQDMGLYVQTRTVALMAACLEGGVAAAHIEECIAGKVPITAFDLAYKTLYVGFEKGKSADKSSKQPPPHGYCPDVTSDILLIAIRDLLAVRSKIVAVTSNYEDVAGSTPPFHNRFLSYMGRVEIFWDGRTEDVYFPLPAESKNLPQTSKTAFVDSCDLTTAESRVSALMDARFKFIDEMLVLNEMSGYTMYQWIVDNYILYKNMLFTLVLLVNMNMILNLEQGKTFGATQDVGYFHNLSNSNVTIAAVLGGLLFFGYGSISFYWGYQVLQMNYIHLQREFDKYSSTTEEQTMLQDVNDLADVIDFNKKKKKPKDLRRDWKAPQRLLAALVVYLCMCIIHFYALSGHKPDNDLRFQYFQMSFIIFVPLTVLTVRKTIISPKSRHDIFVCLVIDSISNFNLMFHVAFTMVCFIAVRFGNTYLFSVLLLDFVTISAHAKNTVRSIVQPWLPLVNVGMMFLIVITVFSIFAFVRIGGGPATFTDADDDSVPWCSSAMTCLGLVLYTGLQNDGQISTVLKGTQPGDSDFTSRFFSDLLFYVIVGLLLFNMVTGIIVDTFSSLREETMERDRLKSEVTFVSGLEYDTLSSSPVSFDDVQEKYQNMWNYVFYTRYLSRKDPSEYNGLEAYVDACIEKGDHCWFPYKTCLELERLGLSSGDEEREVDEENKQIKDTLVEMRRQMDGLQALVAKLNK